MASVACVKNAIDDMVTALLKEKADEIKHKDFCVDVLNRNQIESELKERKKVDLIAKVKNLEMQIVEPSKKMPKSEIAKMQVLIKRMGEEREKVSKEFQAVISEQRATHLLLKATMPVLQYLYGKAGPPPPADLVEYKKSEATRGVMGMINQIIDDAKAMVTEAISDTEDAQKAFEGFAKEVNASLANLVKTEARISTVPAHNADS